MSCLAKRNCATPNPSAKPDLARRQAKNRKFRIASRKGAKTPRSGNISRFGEEFSRATSAKGAKFGESVNGFFVVELLNFAGLVGLARGNPIRKISMSPKDAQFRFCCHFDPCGQTQGKLREKSILRSLTSVRADGPRPVTLRPCAFAREHPNQKPDRLNFPCERRCSMRWRTFLARRVSLAIDCE
jgi:hypothetical protein